MHKETARYPLYWELQISPPPLLCNRLRESRLITPSGIQVQYIVHFRMFEHFRMRSMVSAEGVDEDDARRGIPPDLLAMWDEEEAAVKAKHGEAVAPKPKDRLFNDLLWDHQWYMVRLSYCTYTASTGCLTGCTVHCG